MTTRLVASSLAASFFVCSTLAAVTIAACSTSPSTDPAASSSGALATGPSDPAQRPVIHGHIAPPPNRAGGQPHPGPFAPNFALQYFGGPIIPNVQVYAVLWGPTVNPSVQTGIGPFFQWYVTSEPFKWLSEYSTVGLNLDGGTSSNQTLGTGVFKGTVTITPTITSGMISDAQITAEVAHQIQTGGLPMPTWDANGNPQSIFMLYFPPEINRLTMSQGDFCSQWCAYHDAFYYNGTQVVPYGVMPDATGCSGCLAGSSALGEQTEFSSHELAEATTDVEVGLGNLAWYDPSMGARSGEIGDLCVSSTAVYNGYDIQALWSNLNGGCIFVRPVCDGTMSNAPCRACTTADDHVKWGCTLLTPLCATDAADSKVGQCVQCRTGMDCSSGTPVCDKSGGVTQDTCRGCKADMECTGATSGSLCATSGNSIGQCVQCTPTNMSACTGATPKCDANGACYGCAGNMDCSGATPICDSMTRTCRACAQNSDCGVAGICATGASDPNKGHCVQCLVDSDCHPGFCDTTTDTCSSCTATEGCPNPMPVCTPAHTCTGCRSDTDCAGNKNGGACQTSGACTQCSATNTSGCTGATPACNASQGQCVACMTNADCKDASKICSMNACVACGGAAGACPGGGGGGGGCTAAPAGGASGGGAAGVLSGLALAMLRRRRRAA